MGDPFRLDGPTLLNISGGRTSALMLRRVLDAECERADDARRAALAWGDRALAADATA